MSRRGPYTHNQKIANRPLSLLPFRKLSACVIARSCALPWFGSRKPLASFLALTWVVPGGAVRIGFVGSESIWSDRRSHPSRPSRPSRPSCLISLPTIPTISRPSSALIYIYMSFPSRPSPLSYMHGLIQSDPPDHPARPDHPDHRPHFLTQVSSIPTIPTIILPFSRRSHHARPSRPSRLSRPSSSICLIHPDRPIPSLPSTSLDPRSNMKALVGVSWARCSASRRCALQLSTSLCSPVVSICVMSEVNCSRHA